MIVNEILKIIKQRRVLEASKMNRSRRKNYRRYWKQGRQVEAFDEVVEAIVVGQDWDGDVRVVLFVKLREGATLTGDLVNRIKQRVRANTTPRHVPAKVLQVADIPRTKSGKIVELAVRDVIHGRAVKNVEALANPEALEQFRDRAELATA